MSKGAYGLPFWPPADGWGAPPTYYLGGLWQHRRPSDVVTRWLNQTQVRINTGGTITNGAPFARQDESTFDAENPGSGCNTRDPGFCGLWLAGGDTLGLSAQEVTDTVNDILACAPADATHATIDHNCYVASGTVDTGTNHLNGANWVVAQKSWHGRPGLIDVNDPQINQPVSLATGGFEDPGAGAFTTPTAFANTAPQTRWLTAGIIATSTAQHYTWGGSAYVNDYSLTGSASCTSSVAQYTGIQSQSWSFSYDTHDGDYGPTIANFIFNWLNGKSLADVVGAFAGWDYVTMNGGIGNPSTAYYTASGTTFKLMSGSYTIDPILGIYAPDTVLEEIKVDVAGGSFSRKVYSLFQNPPFGMGGAATVFLIYSETCTISNTSMTYGYDRYFGSTGLEEPWDEHGTGTLSLTVPYTAVDCCADFAALLNAYDLSDTTLGWRGDEYLASAPLCVYDELGPTSPTLLCGAPSGSTASGSGPTMDDYSQPQNGDGTWPQRAWIDPENYVWTSPAGGFVGVPDVGGNNVLNTPMYGGTVLSHTPGGSDRHFWFDYVELTRVSTGSSFDWEAVTHGGQSPAYLPASTVRWQNKMQAQYDSAATSSHGNFPQAWIRQIAGVLMGGKYVEAKGLWRSVNFLRPYGADRWAVDQPTLCCITAGTGAGGSLTVTPTNNAIAPGSAGGLAFGDHVMIGGDGIYIIGAITSLGGGSYTLAVTAHTSAIATGTDIGAPYVGRLRFPTAPPFGLEPVTAAVAAGTTTLTFVNSQAFWTGLTTVSVDLYAATTNASGVVVPAASALASNVTLAIVDAMHGTITGSYGTAVYVVPHGLKPEWDDDGTKGSVIFLDWTFNQRAAAPGYTGSVPTWYAGIAGCLSCSVTPVSIKFLPCCPSVVGWVPATSGSPVESFTNQNLQIMPSSLAFDDYFGAYWQGTVYPTMVDPFWQPPFAPDCTNTIAWTEDDGSGQVDAGSQKYYAHRPLVEALSARPTNGGWSGTDTAPALPSGVSLTFDPGANTFAPPAWPNGIPIGDDSGNYAQIETAYGFAALACADIAGSGRFSDTYVNFVIC